MEFAVKIQGDCKRLWSYLLKVFTKLIGVMCQIKLD